MYLNTWPEGTERKRQFQLYKVMTFFYHQLFIKKRIDPSNLREKVLELN